MFPVRLLPHSLRYVIHAERNPVSTSKGWTHDTASMAIRPPAKEGGEGEVVRGKSGMKQFVGVAEGAARLESVL